MLPFMVKVVSSVADSSVASISDNAVTPREGLPFVYTSSGRPLLDTLALEKNPQTRIVWP